MRIMQAAEPLVQLAALQQVLRELGPLALAVSGGVDSMTLAVVACALEPRSEVFHAVSPAVPAAATARVQDYAARQHWNLQLLDAGEFADPAYRANPLERCYFCKHNLYRSLRRHTALPLAAGTNTDDLQDFRPGLRAAAEEGVVHPLVKAGIDKAGVRAIAAQLGLHELQALPASPCLASRVSTGIAIDPALLPLLDQAEQALRRQLGLLASSADLRCRLRPDGLAVELPLVSPLHQHEALIATVREVLAGSSFAALGEHIVIEPYRRGSAFIRVAT
jgi:pyridinium-3,5-biscarboxylic acid mononucleotide sulfurtransferase